jgi:adenylate kinase family enzyme
MAPAPFCEGFESRLRHPQRQVKHRCKLAQVRYAIIGNSGSGKSTLAARLAARHGLVRLDLDTVAWEPHVVGVPRNFATAAADVARFCAEHDDFVIEGCYEDLIAASFPFRPRLVFLDPGVEVCERHCRQRPFEPHKYASSAGQNEKLESLLRWVRDYYVRQGPMSHATHSALYAGYRGPKERHRSAVLHEAAG